ncbi:MAG: hypothetical protein ACKOEO_25145, partial [Planctomycetaceae bacterium]
MGRRGGAEISASAFFGSANIAASSLVAGTTASEGLIGRVRKSSSGAAAGPAGSTRSSRASDSIADGAIRGLPDTARSAMLAAKTVCRSVAGSGATGAAATGAASRGTS